MRLLSLLVLLGLAVITWADDKELKPITTDEAAKRVNEKCLVEMEVKSVGKSKKGMIFLNSEANYRDGKNFGVVIDANVVPKFKEAKIEDPVSHYKGKRIRVTGTVILFMNHPQIAVTEPAQIQIVEKK